MHCLATMLERLLLVALTPLALAGGTATSWVQSQWLAPGRAAANQQAPAPAGGLPIMRGSDGMLHTIAWINGQAVDMVVDTGASRTILSGADARRVFAERSGTRWARIRTFGGDRDLALQVAASVRIAGRDLGQLEAGSLDDAQVSVIGLDWLSRLGPVTIGAAT